MWRNLIIGLQPPTRRTRSTSSHENKPVANFFPISSCVSGKRSSAYSGAGRLITLSTKLLRPNKKSFIVGLCSRRLELSDHVGRLDVTHDAETKDVCSYLLHIKPSEQCRQDTNKSMVFDACNSMDSEHIEPTLTQAAQPHELGLTIAVEITEK